MAWEPVSRAHRQGPVSVLSRYIRFEKLPATRQVVLHVRWQGGTCTDTTVTLPKPVTDAMRYPTATVEHVRRLSQHLSDPQIVAHLNQEGRRSPTGKSFTLSMVKWIRDRYGIAPTSLQWPDELTVQQLAHRLGISPHVVYYWIERQVVHARKLDGRGHGGSPWILPRLSRVSAAASGADPVLSGSRRRPQASSQASSRPVSPSVSFARPARAGF